MRLFFLLFLICVHFAEAREVFTLERAIEQALQCNRTILGSYDNVQNALLGVAKSKTEFDYKIAPILRTGIGDGILEGEGFKYGGGVEFSKKLFQGTSLKVVPQAYSTDGKWCTDVNIRLTQPILRGFGADVNLSRVLSSEFSHRAAVRNFYLTQVKVVLQTIQGVYEVVKQRENLRISRDSFLRLSGFKESAEVKEKLGLADQTDVLRAEIEMKTAEESLVAAEELFRQAADNLKLILALPMDLDIDVEAPLEFHTVEVDMDQMIETALARRIEIKQAVDKYSETCRLSKVAKNSLWPDLNLVVNYVNSECDESFTSSVVKCCQGTTWGVGVTTNGNIDYASNRLSYEQSRLEVISASREIDQVRAAVVNEVKRQLLAMEKAWQSIELKREQIAKAEQNVKLSRIKFDHGLINNFDVIAPEKTILSSEKALIASIVDHILAEYRLTAAMGLMLDDACIY